MKKEDLKQFKSNLKYLLEREHMNYSACDKLFGKTSFGYTARLVSPSSSSLPSKDIFDKILLNFGVTRGVMMREDISCMSREELNAYIYMDELQLQTKDESYESPFINEKKLDWRTEAELKNRVVDENSRGFSGELPANFKWLEDIAKGYYAIKTLGRTLDPIMSVETTSNGVKRVNLDNSTLKGGLNMLNGKYGITRVYDSSEIKSPILEEKFVELENQLGDSISRRILHEEIVGKTRKAPELELASRSSAVQNNGFESSENESYGFSEEKPWDEPKASHDFFDDYFSDENDAKREAYLTKGYFAEYLKKNGYFLDTEKQRERIWTTKNLDERTEYIEFVNGLNAPNGVKNEVCDRVISGRIKAEWFDVVKMMPFGKMSGGEIDLPRAKEIIDSSHYGMDNVKSQVIQYIAVRKVTGKNPVKILCLDGPPGVGKTSIVKSIAKAMGREFVSISGPSLDEGIDVVGDRESYKSSGPGRIVKALIEAGTEDPVILIDEIDKLKPSGNRTPVPALHEVLDPEQNAYFRDVYLNMHIDLSKVMFVLTSNDQDEIIPSLKDRMEIVSIPGYTRDEKVKIARQYTLKKVATAVGFGSAKFNVTDETLEYIIQGYAPEAGMRELERCLSNIASKHITDCCLSNSHITDLTIGKDDVEKYLGHPKYTRDTENYSLKVGNALGLSVSSLTGGSVLKVEVVKNGYGKGELHCTGNLKDVIVESAKVAFTYVKTLFEDNERFDKFFNESDFHLHIPGGAIPKDGPSAGVTFATAFYSLFMEKAPIEGLAMTGEIDLNGNVLPIGGVKAKCLGAIAAGMKKVIIPAGNRADVEDLPNEIIDQLEIKLVDTAEEVFAIAFGEEEGELTEEFDLENVF